VAQNRSDITVLELGKPIDRELVGGQRQSYQVTLSEGQYIKVEVREHGIDVGVSVEFPPGEITQPWTPLAGGQSLKAISRVAEIAGVYRLDVFAMTKAAPGRYEIRLAELRPATENDRALSEAGRLFRDYSRLRDQGKWLEARALLVRCLEIREKVLGPDDLLVGTTLGFLANSYDHTGDYAVAEPLDLRALKITEKVLGPDDPAVARHVFDLGVNYRDKSDYLKEEKMQRRAWDILERTQSTETALAGAVLEEFGSINYKKGNYQTAEDYFQRGRAVWEKVLGPDHYHLASSFTYSGRAAYDGHDYAKAETMFQKALVLSEKALGQDHSSVTKYRNDLAMLYCTTGDYAKGKALYERSLSAHEQKGSMSYPAVKTTLFGLARCSVAEGNWQEAVNHGPAKSRNTMSP
jgi:tetratricopeptide (TPR) repeat protein